MQMAQHPPVLLGSDPEIFIVDNNGTPIPAFDQFGGTKTEPLPMKGMPQGFFFQEDGAALEFNVPPAATAEEFVKNIELARTWIGRNLLAQKHFTISSGNVLRLKKANRTHPKAQEIGCSKDYYAWDEGPMQDYQRRPFVPADMQRERYAGCHLHLSLNIKEVPAHVAAHLMDLFVGVRAVAAGTDLRQGGRRKFYGLAGLYRPKDYGIEYRTLSSSILNTLRPQSRMVDGSLLTLASWSLELGRTSYEDLPRLYRIYERAPWGDVRRAIEEEDQTVAQRVVEWVRANY